MQHPDLREIYGLKWNPFSPDVPVETLWKAQDLDTFFWRVGRMVTDGGFALVTGEPGTGKSVALRQLAHHLAQTPDTVVGVLARPQSSLADFYAMNKLPRDQYVRHVLALYQATPGTRGRIRIADRRLAEKFHDNGTTTETVRNALLLAAARRNHRPQDAEPLQPIASLHYFLPVIHEVQKNPPDPGYVQYLKEKLADYQDGFRRPPNHRSS